MVVFLAGTAEAGTVQAVETQDAALVQANAPITYKMATPHSIAPTLPTPDLVKRGQQALKQAVPSMLTHAPKPNFAPMSLPERAADFTRELQSYQFVGRPYKVAGKTYVPAHNPDFSEVGTASRYDKRYHGKMTASGEIFDANALTVAHRTLPLNSYVNITNMASGKSVKVRVNDRGPFTGNAIVDISDAVAAHLGLSADAAEQVRVDYAGPAKPAASAPKVAQNSAAPQAQTDYQPVREMPTPARPDRAAPPSTHLAAPQHAAPHMPVRPVVGNDYYLHIPDVMSPGAAAKHQHYRRSLDEYLPKMTQIPEPDMMGGADDTVTLTIKGPVHMAVDKLDSPRPDFIRDIYRADKTEHK